MFERSASSTWSTGSPTTAPGERRLQPLPQEIKDAVVSKTQDASGDAEMPEQDPSARHSWEGNVDVAGGCGQASL